MATDLRHTPVLGGEEGYPDLVAMPDLDTLVPLPWEPDVALVPGRPRPGRPAARRSPTRAAPSAAPSRGSQELGFTPQIGPELEFFLLERDPDAPGGVRRRVDRPSMVYTVGPQVDPGGFVRG